MSNPLRCVDLVALVDLERAVGNPGVAEHYEAAMQQCARSGGVCQSPFRCRPEQPLCTTPATVTALPERPRSWRTQFGAAEVVPLATRRDVLVWTDSTTRMVERTGLPLDDLVTAQDRLGAFWRQWLALPGEGARRVTDLDWVQVADIDMLGRFHVVDVSPRQPKRFRILAWGVRITMGTGRPLSGTRFGDFPSPALVDSALYDIERAKRGLIGYARMRGTAPDGSSYRYRRLVLPARTGLRRTTDRVVIAVEFESTQGPIRAID
ncbi:MAG: hypothetical protein SF002_10005 [Alphaproteobacteria bacterium]|nr:hypothetical protein [Alphaproteobacteria bacterium]